MPQRYDFPAVFECSFSDGTLSWVDAGASTYYLQSTVDGVNTYRGAQQSTSATVPGADSYRVRFWTGGTPTDAVCDGDGVAAPVAPVAPAAFECSHSGGVLTWTGGLASTFYLQSTTGGVNTYLGSSQSDSATVPGADSYRVRFWTGPTPTDAVCDGDGVAAPVAPVAPVEPCLLYTSPSPRDATLSRMPSSA